MINKKFDVSLLMKPIHQSGCRFPILFFLEDTVRRSGLLLLSQRHVKAASPSTIRRREHRHCREVQALRHHSPPSSCLRPQKPREYIHTASLPGVYNRALHTQKVDNILSLTDNTRVVPFAELRNKTS